MKLDTSQSMMRSPDFRCPVDQPNSSPTSTDRCVTTPTASVISTKYVPQNHCQNVRMLDLLFGAKSSMPCQGVT